ncbi:DNA primase [Sphingomonas montanisoli]|uniref:DNA primase n=1 Tax=Sphingomonas montanisoli TaxID=2606412 RepID=A0A5D9C7F5_9SPHN|nr:DNA primase [Sphingomonas montanisoli]TZG25985.1 DNA primase [Sphingomonas montanisoli]
MSLSPQFLDEIRARTTLSTLIGKSVKLTKAGREYKACCPFHNEKSPSFYVNDDKGFYHCFGCSAHGDAIRFLTESQGLPFIDAVKELAAAAGMEMPAPDPRAAERHERELGLHEVTGAAERWFVDQLGGIEGAEARAYLKRRGIDEALQKAFGIGFAPDSRGKLKAALKQYGDGPLVETGMLIQVEGKEPYDRFRGRVMIPIRDQRGRTIAFGGRILDTGEPKYLNSPETPLFDKGRSLFNIDRAGPASRKADRIIVVEGYMDVIALAKAGIDEAVAPLGTALTEGQMERLWRLADAPILCFDGDKAGQKAALRAAQRAFPILQPGKSLGFITLPGGQDPDDFLKANGRDAFEAYLARPRSIIDIVWDAEAADIDSANPDDRANLRFKLDEFAATCPNQIIAAEYKRAFRDMFYEQFGWKKQERVAIANATLRTKATEQTPLPEMFMRALLIGLSRQPQLIGKHAEEIAQLEIEDKELSNWHRAIFNAAITRPGLDSDAMESILDSLKLTARQRRGIQAELPYSFLKPGTPSEDASMQLSGMIEQLSRGQAIREEWNRLEAQLVADLSEADYQAVESALKTLRLAEAELRERGYKISGISAEG